MSIRILISGRVHNVGFRYFCKRNAKKMGVEGTARNLDNGEVEVIVKGQEDKLKKYIRKLKEGPMLARVDDIVVEDCELEDEVVGFEILR